MEKNNFKLVSRSKNFALALSLVLGVNSAVAQNEGNILTGSDVQNKVSEVLKSKKMKELERLKQSG